MADVELTFMQDLPAHADPEDMDLLLVNTNGDDKSLTLKKLAEYISFENIYPVGIVTWFAQNKNPNDLFPGSKWSYIGEDKVIRLAKEDGSDLMMTGGSDSVKLTTENLPVHSHTFSGNTSSFDYGTKGTSENGSHSHKVPGRPNITNNKVFSGVSAGWVEGDYWEIDTKDSGNHNHSVYIGTHSHTVSGNTNSTGSSSDIDVVNKFVKLMGWYRLS